MQKIPFAERAKEALKNAVPLRFIARCLNAAHAAGYFSSPAELTDALTDSRSGALTNPRSL